ncbi:transmembrane emp24 domain-containing protein 7 isoform X1 [Brachyhypopomus gauderio]|uniref:transmembrane emp24 domain-containing protein 7 isoform X1 n=2 Tax=Brachyhypopomus gauderio TaxID=698409 RepID=UPI0040437C07
MKFLQFLLLHFIIGRTVFNSAILAHVLPFKRPIHLSSITLQLAMMLGYRRGPDMRVWVQVLCVHLLWGWVWGSELTFELPDNAKQCFYEDITMETKCTLEFQVVTGGHYDVDCRLEDPDGTVLYKEMKKQYDSFTFTAAKNGTYKFCFSNEFSTFTHKTVYFDFQVGEDPPLFPNENRVTALTQMESACVSIHEALKSVIDYQTHFRLREAQGRSRAEDLNTRVAFWSIGEAFILLVVSISQVVLLRSFFSDKKTTTTRVGS